VKRELIFGIATIYALNRMDSFRATQFQGLILPIRDSERDTANFGFETEN